MKVVICQSEVVVISELHVKGYRIRFSLMPRKILCICEMNSAPRNASRKRQITTCNMGSTRWVQRHKVSQKRHRQKPPITCKLWRSCIFPMTAGTDFCLSCDVEGHIIRFLRLLMSWIALIDTRIRFCAIQLVRRDILHVTIGPLQNRKAVSAYLTSKRQYL